MTVAEVLRHPRSEAAGCSPWELLASQRGGVGGVGRDLGGAGDQRAQAYRPSGRPVSRRGAETWSRLPLPSLVRHD